MIAIIASWISIGFKIGRRKDHVARALLEWIGQVVAAPTRLGAAADFAGIVVTLLRMEPAARPRDATEALVLALQYQLTVQLHDPFAAQRALGELAFAAMVHPDFAFAGAEASTAPTLLLTARLARARHALRAPPVRLPLRAVLRTSPAAAAGTGE